MSNAHSAYEQNGNKMTQNQRFERNVDIVENALINADKKRYFVFPFRLFINPTRIQNNV